MLVNWVTLYKHITVDGFLRFLFLMRRLKVEHQAKPRNLAIVQTFLPQKMQVRHHKNHSAPNSMKNDFFYNLLTRGLSIMLDNRNAGNKRDKCTSDKQV